MKDPEDFADREFEVKGSQSQGNNAGSSGGGGVGSSNQNNFFEQRNFMYCRYLHHPGLAAIQYKTFFHMCRLESISFDMEKRSGSTFVLSDCLQSGVIAMLTIGVHRRVTVNFMVEALNFI